MSYRFLDNIDEKIIDATIKVGSENGANKLSTKEIAKVCDISEFVIYDHFKSKENLVSIADKKIAETIMDEALRILKINADLVSFYSSMVDFCLTKRDYTAFTINYGHIFPRTAKPTDYDSFMSNVFLPVAKEGVGLLKLHFPDEMSCLHLWLWLFQNVIIYCQLVTLGSMVDSKQRRFEAGQLVASGLNAFLIQ
jgi:AcrR family transcriptional regulator